VRRAILALLLTFPAFGLKSYSVCASGCDYSNLQTAIDAAVTYQDGTLCETTLLNIAAGETFTGNFVLKAKTCQQYIRLRSSGLALQGTGRATASSTNRAILTAATNSITSTVKTEDALGTGYYALEGLEITTPASNSSYVFALVGLSEDPSSEKQEALTPHHITLDRNYIHGQSGNIGPTRCVAVHGRNIEITNNYISSCKQSQSNGDAQAVWVGSAPGPVYIVNNYLEATGENILIGGGYPNPIAGMSQRNIFITGNYLDKNIAWKYEEGTSVPTWPCTSGENYYRTSASQGYTCSGGSWVTTGTTLVNYMVKNIIELKEGKGVYVQGNVINKSWREDQSGQCFMQNQSTDVFSQQIRDFYIIGNWCQQTLVFLGGGFGSSMIYPDNIVAEHNLHTNMGAYLMGKAQYVFPTFALQTSYNGALKFSHNTIATPIGGTAGVDFDASSITRSVGTETGQHSLRDNALPPADYLFNRDGYASNGWCSWLTGLDLGLLDMRNNLVTIGSGTYTTSDTPGCPSYYDFPESTVWGTSQTATDTNPSGGDWTMKAAGPGADAASDGSDIGVDFDILNSSTEGAVAGTLPLYATSGFRQTTPASTSVSFVYAAPTTTTCTAAVSTSRGFGSTVGSPTTSQTGRGGSGSVTGLSSNASYWLRLSCGGAYKYYAEIQTK